MVLDMEGGRAEIKLGPKAMGQQPEGGPPARINLIPNDYVSGGTMARSLRRIAEHYRDTGELPPALEDLLHRRRPRIDGERGEAVARAGETGLETALRLVPKLSETTLCIQGPPGAGKTYTGGQVIVELLRQKRRVGVSTNSHKAILNLMKEVADVAREKGVALDGVKVGGDPEEPMLKECGFRYAKDAGKLVAGGDLPLLIGGTAWVFSHEGMAGQLDTLFVDEAGQVSLANLAAMCPSARNVVLLGDQMQLGQPSQGSHPGESGQSSLEYLLQDHATVPDDLGIFLGTTWRMHPDVCRFISGAVYEDRLQPEPHTAKRGVVPVEGGRIPSGCGVLFVPVEHEANRQGSDEEVEAIAGLVEDLLRSRHTDQDGDDAGRLTLKDILVVAPFNYQVRLLKERLGPEARVGTIDKFQGQEAAVSIVSMSASSADVSPRGLDFLFEPNRMNVAISRARSLAIVVGNPGLARTACSTVEHMRRVNLFCRVVA
jgi:uncharacterized protein